MNIDRLLVSRCAPTLAGIKMAALVCVPISTIEDYQEMIDQYNRKFNQQGLYFTTLWCCKNNRHVLYVYRKDEVRKYLCSKDVTEFLAEYGYEAPFDIDKTIAKLVQRFMKESTFPHELGVFLGYPLDDVKSFVANKGDNALYCGEWKVYNNVNYAKEEFLKYETCRRCYIEIYNQGCLIEHLVIA